MKKHFLLGVSCITLGSVSQGQQTVLETNKRNNELIEPAGFKTVFPFSFTEGSQITVTTYWGKEHKPIKLIFDNAAPTSVDAVTKSNLADVQETGESDKDRLMPTGQKITTHFLVAPNVRFGDINVRNVAFLTTPYVRKTASGLLGRNILKKGVWKIDFENKMITFANSTDSIGPVDKMDKLPVKFDYFDRITVKMTMEKKMTDVFEVDFGYNGAVTLPFKQFSKLAKDGYVRKASGTATTAAGAVETNYYLLEHGILTFKDETYLDFTITSSDVIKDKLLGLGFFSQFKYVIIDYVNKALYLSREKVASYYKTKL